MVIGQALYKILNLSLDTSTLWVVLCRDTYAYDCGPPGSGHCYSQFDINDPRGDCRQSDCIHGSSTVIDVRLPARGDGFVTEEMWYGSSDFGIRAWIEAGYQNSLEGFYWFWANGSFNEPDPIWDETFIGYADPSGTGRITMSIDPSGFSDRYWVRVEGPGPKGIRYNYRAFAANSVLVKSAHHDVSIGSELQGSTGAAAPIVRFTQNYVMTWNMGGNPINVWRSVGGTPTATVQTPWWGGWIDLPQQNATGGTFYTECCKTPQPITQIAKPPLTFGLPPLPVREAPSEPAGIPAIKVQRSSRAASTLVTEVRNFAQRALEPRLHEVTGTRA